MMLYVSYVVVVELYLRPSPMRRNRVAARPLSVFRMRGPLTQESTSDFPRTTKSRRIPWAYLGMNISILSPE